ncbi:hypothetical protein DFJ74DRAFT_714805 [Hyaloraphidium curvatum]|nr:hypothetical protein DFJ74DRAFT_714805 [Hyaloraphidium curvatum]
MPRRTPSPLVESLRPCGLLVVVIADRADAANVSRACPDCSVAAGDGVDERRGCVDAFARAWALPFSEVAYFAPNALAVKVTGPDGACGLLGDAALARLPVNAVLAAGGPLDGDAPDPSVVVLRPHVRTAAAIKEWADATPHASPAELLAAFFSPGDQSPNSQSPKPGKWFRLPRTSNVQTSMARLPGYPALADRAAVLVFDGPARPWDFFRTASPRWRDSFDPAAWWAWQRAANAAREGRAPRDGQAARWAGRQASCNALFGQTGGADPGNGAAATMGLLPWPVSRTLLPPPPGSRGGKLAVLLATFDRALDTVALLLRHYAASPPSRPSTSSG